MVKRIFFWFIIVANLIGASIGFTVYFGQQFLSTNPLLWVFVADAPLYAVLFVAAFFFRGKPKPEALVSRFRKLPDLSLLWFLAFVGVLKYGFFSVFTHLLYFQFYFTPEGWFMSSVLFVATFLMITQLMLLIRIVKVKASFLLVGIVWFLLNDIVDFTLGLHSRLPESSLGFMFPATMAMSVGFTILSYLILKRYSGSSMHK